MSISSHTEDDATAASRIVEGTPDDANVDRRSIFSNFRRRPAAGLKLSWNTDKERKLSRQLMRITRELHAVQEEISSQHDELIECRETAESGLHALSMIKEDRDVALSNRAFLRRELQYFIDIVERWCPGVVHRFRASRAARWNIFNGIITTPSQ